MLQWVLPRQEPIRALNADQLSPSHDLDADEIKFLTLVAGSAQSADEQLKSDKFWAIASLIWPLADWGHHVVNWLHACPCPKPCSSTSKSKAARSNQCPLKGRRAIQMACGQMGVFITKLHSVGINPRAHEFMKGLSTDTKNSILTSLEILADCRMFDCGRGSRAGAQQEGGTHPPEQSFPASCHFSNRSKFHNGGYAAEDRFRSLRTGRFDGYSPSPRTLVVWHGVARAARPGVTTPFGGAEGGAREGCVSASS